MMLLGFSAAPNEHTLPALILKHQSASPAGLLLDALQARGLEFQIVRVDQCEPLPDPGSVAFAVSLGADASANDTQLPWIAWELEWMRVAHDAGTPVLGLSFGAQLLALALGGAVQLAARPERGVVRISTRMPDLIAAGPWPSWHDEAIVLPRGAELLAHNGSGPQAFRVGNHIGVQFHPEVTPEIASGWVLHQRNHGLDSQTVLEGLARERAATTVNAHRLFSAFIDGELSAPSFLPEVRDHLPVAALWPV